MTPVKKFEVLKTLEESAYEDQKLLKRREIIKRLFRSSDDQEEEDFIETQTKRLAMLQKVAKKRRGRKRGDTSSYLSALSKNEGPSNAQVIDIEYIKI